MFDTGPKIWLLSKFFEVYSFFDMFGVEVGDVFNFVLDEAGAVIRSIDAALCIMK